METKIHKLLFFLFFTVSIDVFSKIHANDKIDKLLHIADQNVDRNYPKSLLSARKALRLANEQGDEKKKYWLIFIFPKLLSGKKN